MARSRTGNRPLTPDEAWIVSQNLPLVESCLRGRRRFEDALYEDLRSVGYLGLCRAIKLYDPERAMWSTYACVWIKSFIGRELRRQNMIAIPEWQRWNVNASNARGGKLRYNRQAQLALNIKRVSWTDDEADHALAVMPPREPEHDDNQFIAACLDKLPDRSREIVQRVVMGGERLYVVAAELGCNRATARNLKQKALKILRVSMREHLP